MALYFLSELEEFCLVVVSISELAYWVVDLVQIQDSILLPYVERSRISHIFTQVEQMFVIYCLKEK
jgi:hypothetical protein